MASQQQYHAYAQNKGTLTSGQSISVGKFTVQVERYLSQGGFSHVYLVRTATPVYNTTHHVLKRIAVANEAMLTEVRKEVDIMRLLKGHPNIVHLIDAAWHKVADGTFEVFILMEFCPGGGIIDMMNRRLRERLTESEIMQIFVDVCEGVAYMHNSRPPLLHRDLKVENILQSSSTSYKLCDFGSATVVDKPPASTNEIRALEADLNRHTTLQYRAPEMVDLYSRRPVDEKSDVWALGVLLYKLCYYTTPFEEHGPLAIINVQYRIPPYPVYSTQMNQLIASMLQERGSQRPNVFELLSQVHSLRKTKSRFQYTIPISQPLSARHETQIKPPPSQNHIETPVLSAASSSVASSSRKPELISSSGLTQGIHARDISVDDLPLMRRGRPTGSKESVLPTKPETLPKPISTQAASSERAKHWVEEGFVPDDDRAWKAALANTATSRKDGFDDVWKVGGTDLSRTVERKDKQQDFGDDFAERLWESFDDRAYNPTQVKAGSNGNSLTRASTVSARTYIQPSAVKGKDAFEGLGLDSSSDRPAPTLGEARKLRTGLLGITRSNGSGENVGPSPSRLTPPRQTYLSSSPSQSQFLSTAHRPSSSASGMSWRSSPQPAARPSPSVQPEGLPAETRYPSLEDLDATFASNSKHAGRNTKPQIQQAPDTPALPPRNRKPSLSIPGTSELPMRPAVQPPAYAGGVRSEQVTGIAMREPQPDTNGHRVGLSKGRADGPCRKAGSGSQSSSQSSLVQRPPLTRRHRSSITIKHTPPSITADVVPASPLGSLTVENLASKSPRLSTESKDWLTGDDDLPHTSTTSVLVPAPPVETVVFRESPSKRASVTQKSTVPIQDAIFPQYDHTPSLKRTPSPPASAASDISPTISRFTRTFPPISTTDHHQRDKATPSAEDSTPIATRTVRTTMEIESSSSADEGPEDVGGYRRTVAKAPSSIERPKRKGRQSSVHHLVDLWSGGMGHKDSEQKSQTPRPPASDDPQTPLHGHKAGPVASPLSSAKSNPNPKIQTLTPHDFRARKAPNSDSRRSPPSRGTTPSMASRSRPQSMIIFPSKSADAFTTLSSGHSSGSSSLIPPHNTNQRSGGRRTSISNMVQRYEGISGKGKPAGSIGSPSPTTPRSAAKAGSLLTENGRVSRGQARRDQVGLLPPTNDASHRQRSSSPIENGRISPSPSRMPPINPPSPLPHDGIATSSENAVSRVPKLSFNREASKPVFASVSKLVEEPSIRPGDERSSSPERPYQGVGKLIDQWQRKTAEASSTRTAIGRGRGSAVGKRGVVHDISGSR